MLSRALQGFNDRAARPPGAFQLGVLTFVAIAIPLWLGSERGIGVGIFAALVWGAMLFLAAWRHAELIAWSAAHPYLDLLWFPPLVFLALAGSTAWSLGWCAVAAAIAGAALATLKMMLTRARSERERR